MLRKIIKNIVTSIADDKYSEEEQEQMEYVLRTILFELIKMVSLIIIFSLFGYFKEILIISGVMCIIKPFIGGYHEDTQIKCFIATLLLTAGILILSMQTNLSFLSNLILVCISIFCIWNQAPVINSKMPITRSELINKNRIRGLSTTIVFGLASMVLHNYVNYYSLITWTIVVETMLMFNKKEY